ncbi:hypothetical protein BO94DRAFT_600988 [Aspergillus sclerotioniger CBS 115572]|uniref:DUF4246 domain-containing protein n=1 Tax=Aspergillus sclerotioniger CBS 115572 TaxID=1450535 RepID=A0A317XGG2_9EURO|nr:hypothetical protein BO94DRAFT_600988 [Aspergillus sclerotioniger CBS 115572]PWY95980.1 hypothetical protein BO94DRAFT_600988 [Aspergillus sclerotioniger CBS 115572]
MDNDNPDNDHPDNGYSGICYVTDSDHSYQSYSVQDKFREKGLQVIVRISSVELTPENPHHCGEDDFSLSRLMNEHIVCMSRYYYDVENLTPAWISFQQQDTIESTPAFDPESHANRQIFGFSPIKKQSADQVTPEEKGIPRKLQILGSVSAHKGRLLVWPNTLRSRTHPFSLKDKTCPGHQRYITIWLVDSVYRICSTRNVPAQQNHWWREAMQPHMPHLPPELMQMIMEETGPWPMGMTEAKKWKTESDAERDKAGKAQSQSVPYYNFWHPRGFNTNRVSRSSTWGL